MRTYETQEDTIEQVNKKNGITTILNLFMKIPNVLVYLTIFIGKTLFKLLKLIWFKIVEKATNIAAFTTKIAKAIWNVVRNIPKVTKNIIVNSPRVTWHIIKNTPRMTVKFIINSPRLTKHAILNLPRWTWLFITKVTPYIGIYLVLFLFAFIIIYPVFWIVGSSFNTGNSVSSGRAIPRNFTLDNYKRLFDKTNYTTWYFNTFKIAILNMILSVFLSGTMGYVFARLQFVGKKFGLLFILVLQMFPTFMGIIAIYILFLNFGLLDQPLALVLIYSAGQIPYNTWLIKGYLTNIPKSLDEAAYIDGATKFQVFTQVLIPVMVPILSFVAITQFMAPWFDFILPSFLISTSSKKTLAVGLFDLINGQQNNNFTMFAAGAVLVAAPIALLYFYLQKYLIEGLAAGANKE
jgi:arabinogalactan oligomer/maltooligosaccharide transport system permease protein